MNHHHHNHSSSEEEGLIEGPKEEWTNEERLGFIRKVYGILASQLLLTALMCILPFTSPKVRNFFLANFGLAIGCAIGAVILSCALVCCQNLARKVPTNYYLLLAFTILEAYTVAFVCATVKDPLIVLAAAFMTAAIVIALTAYAVFTKTDFTACGGCITVIGCAFVIFSLFSFLFGPTMHLIYCILGVIVFGIYLVFDTQYIVGGNHR